MHTSRHDPTACSAAVARQSMPPSHLRRQRRKRPAWVTRSPLRCHSVSANWRKLMNRGKTKRGDFFDVNNPARRSRFVSRSIRAAAAAAAVLLCLSAVSQARIPDLDILAAQLRKQGFTCNKPISAQVVEGEAPLQKVYMLKCEGETYRMRLVPDQAAKIVQIK